MYRTFLRPAKDLKKLGPWAVVTGATDGIGRAYAFAFAQRGLNVLLISRTESKLQEVQAELTRAHGGVQVRYLVCDYAKFDATAKQSIQKAMDELEVGILVNNVGLSYRYPQYFDELSDAEVTDLLALNVESTVWMTRAALPGMLQRRRGAIVNLSSGSALYTLPLLAEYSGAKSFVEKFSRALNAEYRRRGVTCQCQVPFYVATKLARMRKSAMVPTPSEYVDQAVRWIGHPESVVQPFWLHAVQGWVLSQLPEFLVERIIMGMHLGIRKKGQQKDKRET